MVNQQVQVLITKLRVLLQKLNEMTDLEVISISQPDSNGKYTLKWKSDDNKTITADLTKNKDVKITSKTDKSK